jgi:hypothetical protein
LHVQRASIEPDRCAHVVASSTLLPYLFRNYYIHSKYISMLDSTVESRIAA